MKWLRAFQSRIHYLVSDPPTWDLECGREYIYYAIRVHSCRVLPIVTIETASKPAHLQLTH